MPIPSENTKAITQLVNELKVDIAMKLALSNLSPADTAVVCGMLAENLLYASIAPLPLQTRNGLIELFVEAVTDHLRASVGSLGSAASLASQADKG